MTQYGGKIPNITTEKIQKQLSKETNPKAIKRLTVAREYLAGLSPAEIEDKYGWDEQTVYNWLNRFEKRDFKDALYDDNRSGRPSKLNDKQFEKFKNTLHKSPKKAGYNTQVWSSKLAQQYLLEEFEIAYSQRHVRRLMHKAGLSPKKPKPQSDTVDEDEREQFKDTVEKNRQT